MTVICNMLCMQLLSVSHERFAVSLDEKFGQTMWVDFPETANKGKGGGSCHAMYTTMWVDFPETANKGKGGVLSRYVHYYVGGLP